MWLLRAENMANTQHCLCLDEVMMCEMVVLDEGVTYWYILIQVSHCPPDSSLSCRNRCWQLQNLFDC